MVRINRLQSMYHSILNVLHLLSDPIGLLDELVHDISLVLWDHFQLRWLLELLNDLLEDIPLLDENIPSIVVFSVLLYLVFCDHVSIALVVRLAQEMIPCFECS